jgi:IMP dehydrogenase
MALSNKFLPEGLTYDDVLLVPAYSEVMPRDTQMVSSFSKGIKLNVPIVSAAMDTVTEHDLAIAIAQEGGIGVLHKNMSIAAQADEVRKVKRSESGMIQDPVVILYDATIGEALNLMKEHSIGGIPVIDTKNKLVGIVTNRDLRFEKDMKRPVADVMTKKNIITTTKGTSLEKAELILQDHKIEKLPVVDKDNHLVGLITFKDIMKGRIKPNASKDKFGRLRVAAAVGVTADTMERVAALVNAGVDAIIIDTAHGHSKGVIDTLKKVKKQYKDLQVIVGNIATGEAALDLYKAGADAVKVGIGPGSICTTRVIAGVGVPQLSAIMLVAEALQGKCPIIADGGIRFTGDIVKALAAGASTVMMGSMFAGAAESPGETIIFEGRKFKSYRGMGSLEAMQKGSKDRYFQDAEDDIKKLVPEGISGRVPFKGNLAEIMYQFIGGLRAGMGYCGAKNIAALQKAKFIRITSAGVKESHPHDVVITREAPNYSR